MKAPRTVWTVAAMARSVTLVACVTAFSTDLARAYELRFVFTDPVEDHTGTVDVVEMVFTFDNTTGDYEILLTADAANPFSGQFRININLFNPDSGGGGSVENLFLRGDSNSDGAVDISDSVLTLNYLFVGGLALTCQDAADTNDDGRVDISDPIGAFGVLFLGNGIIPLPGMIECGVDPTDDALDCEHHESCL